MTVKVYVIGSSVGYARPIYDSILVDNIEEADVVVLTGGADVDPSTYGRTNVASWGSKSRDDFEIEEYKKVRPNQLVYGCCRGEQLLTILNGGNLVQDVKNHGIYGYHNMIDNDGNIWAISSLHHQMAYPYDLDPKDYTVLMKSYPARSADHYIGDGINKDKIMENGEPEVIVFHKEGSPIGLGVQGHPEMMEIDHPTVKEFNRILREWLEIAKQNG